MTEGILTAECPQPVTPKMPGKLKKPIPSTQFLASEGSPKLDQMTWIPVDTPPIRERSRGAARRDDDALPAEP